MQHLRQVGLHEEGVESVLLEAPTTSKKKPSKKKGSNFEDSLLRDLPEEALPSKTELPRDFVTQSAVPDELTGLQPDMDPHLRQTLEALEDEAFVDEGVEDDFFKELVEGGEREEGDEEEFEFNEYGEVDEAEEEEDRGEEQDWEARFKQFKKEQAKRAEEGGDVDDVNSESGFGSDDGRSEAADTMGELPVLPTSRKKRRKGTSDASGYSMSSSSMFRNAGLTLLDEKFDKVCLFP
jgi:protein LTV1